MSEARTDSTVAVAASPASAAGQRARSDRAGIGLRARLVGYDLVALGAGWSTMLLVADNGRLDDTLMVVSAVAAAQLSIRAQGLYETWVNTMRVVVVARLMRTALVGGLTAAAVEVARTGHASMAAIVVGTLASYLLLVFLRGAFDRWLCEQRRRGAHHRPIVVFGGDADVAEIVEYLDEHPELGYRVVGWAGPGEDVPRVPRVEPAIDGAAEQVRAYGASGALVMAGQLERGEVNDLCRRLVDAGLHVHVSSALAGINYRRLVSVPVGREPFVRLAPVRPSPLQLAAKRAMDIVLSALLLVLALPLLAVAAALVKRHDRGPIFFSQGRVGQDGKAIKVHKLRSMVVDAEDLLDELLERNERDGPLFKIEDDPRITPIGRVLRKTSIDELPQLWDILRGDLSLVGPRPALPSEVEAFDQELQGRLRVRPGLTGLWQVEARDKATFNSYRRLDLFYVENWSLALDIAIILDTVPAVLGRALSRAHRTNEHPTN